MDKELSKQAAPVKKTVAFAGRQYNVHFGVDGQPTDVVVISKGRPYRNIGTTGPVAVAAIAIAREAL